MSFSRRNSWTDLQKQSIKNMPEMIESKKRSLLKAISYRVICVISMMVITLLITKNVSQSVYITVVFQTIQTALYYLHERLWAQLPNI